MLLLGINYFVNPIHESKVSLAASVVKVKRSREGLTIFGGLLKITELNC